MCEMSKKGFKGMLIKNPEKRILSQPPVGGNRGGGGEGKGYTTKTDLCPCVRCLRGAFKAC